MDETKNISAGTARKIIAAVILAGIAAFAALNCLQPIIPAIGSAFRLRPAAASTIVGAGMLGIACALFILTFFAERLPRKRGICFGLLVCSLLTAALGNMPGFGAMLAVRVLVGVSIALVPTLVMAYIQEEMSADKTAYIAGLYISGTTLGGLSGRLSLAFLTDVFDWRLAITFCGAILFCISLAACVLLPQERHEPGVKKKFDWEFFSLSNKSLYGICFIAFSIMGSFVAIYNFIPFVLRAAPYNFSQSLIGLIFLVQIFGSLSSAMSGKLIYRFGTVKVIVIDLFIMLLGILLTLHAAVAVKLAGLCAVDYGFFGAHACAIGWCGSLCPQQKAASVALYMFCYYCGASVLGSAGGLFFQAAGWNGIVSLVALAILCSLVGLYFVRSWQKVYD